MFKFNKTSLIAFFIFCPYLLHNIYCQDITWTEVEPGIYKGTAGKPEKYNLLTVAGAKPNTLALEKLGKSNFPLAKSEISAKIVDGKTYLRFPLQVAEQIFGFGLNFRTLYQRGKVLDLQVDNYTANVPDGRTHVPTPFYVSSLGYGVFINSARFIKVYAGSAVQKDSKTPAIVQDRNTDKNWSPNPYSDGIDILVPAEGVDVYIFAGPKMIDAVSRFNLFNGGGCLPPRWGLGFMQRVKTLYDENMVRKEVNEFEEKGYPLDVIGLEPGWQSKSYPCSFEWDATRFSNPSSFTKEILNKSVRLNLWTNPYISPDASIYSSIKPYTGTHTVWNGAVADMSLPAARDIFFGQLKKSQIDIGISGYKFDEVDGGDRYLWPDVALFPSGNSAEQMRQTYGLMMARYSSKLFHNINQRTYGLIRANSGVGCSFPYVIYNDTYDHREFITALINSGFAGTLWTPEVRASKSAEEWVRRFQSNIFSPMAMINAWASGTKPWSYPEVAEQIKSLALLRMRMMPYWYTEFAKYHFQGIPPFRAMNFEDGFNSEIKKESRGSNLEDNPYAEATNKEIKDQYMAGEYLLVAPMFAGQSTRKVVLPKGKWFDFYTGNYVGNGEIITVTPGIDKIPVYVKDGGIIPLMDPMLHSPKAGEKVDLEICYYGSKPGKYFLYDDDGETFNYERGDYSFREIKIQRNKIGEFKGTLSNPEPNKPNTIAHIKWKFMTKD